MPKVQSRKGVELACRNVGACAVAHTRAHVSGSSQQDNSAPCRTRTSSSPGSELANMSKKSPWVRAKSSSHPDHYYYFNRVTRASTWDPPPGFDETEIPSLPPKERVNKNVRHSRGE